MRLYAFYDCREDSKLRCGLQFAVAHSPFCGFGYRCVSFCLLLYSTENKFSLTGGSQDSPAVSCVSLVLLR